MATRVYMIRHAQSFPSSKLAEAAWPLSDQGTEQADRLGALLEPLGISSLYSSPYERCLRTIGPLANRSGLDVNVKPGLRERKIATTVRTDFTELWQRSWNDFSFALPECESSLEAQERFVETVYELVDESEGTIGVCAHGNVIGLLLNHLDPAFGLAGADRLRNPDVIGLDFRNGTLTWDNTYELDGMDSIATHPRETPIAW